MILTPLQKLTKNVGDLGKIIVVKCFEWLPKVQKIAQSGHTARYGLLDPSAPTILRVPIPSRKSMLFQFVIELWPG